MRLLPDESAGSLVFRLAGSEFVSVSDYCRNCFSLAYARIRSDLDNLLPRLAARRLAYFSRISVSQIRKLIVAPEWRIPTWDPGARRHCAAVRFCPLCLQESRYGQRFWLTRFAAACPIHGVELLNHCPYCGAVFPYFGAPANVLIQYWLETWPLCPNCLHRVELTVPAHPVLVRLSGQWHEALNGCDQLGFAAQDFLRFSKRLIDRFTQQAPYVRTAEIVGCSANWRAHAATALLLNTVQVGNISKSVFYAAIDRVFSSAQLAKDISV